METGLSDTSPEAERLLIEGYRRMPAWQKLHLVEDLNRTVEQLALGDIRRRYPQADEHELKLRLAARYLEPDLMRRVFGWDPAVEGY